MAADTTSLTLLNVSYRNLRGVLDESTTDGRFPLKRVQ